MGLAEEEFWKLSFSELTALIERWRRNEEQQDYRMGVIAATIANVMTTKKKTYKPQDFMPKKRRGKKQSVRDMIAVAESMTGKKADVGEILGE